MNLGPHCYSLPPGAPFLHSLAAWLLAEYGQDSGAFTRLLVLLPHRRACRGLREAFLDITGGKPLLLPRIQPIGDADAQELFFDTPDIPQPISPVRRQFLLMQLVMRFQAGQGHGSVEQAAELARGLSDFIDETAREGLDFSGLAELAPESLAGHWQQTLDFLRIVSHEWPALLAAEDLLDPVARRNLLLAELAARWRSNPPSHPIIAAGSTGSQPATAALLAAIAHVPQGRVILPGLDHAMIDSEWDAVSDTHPQYGLKQLLGRMGISRAQVKPFPHVEEGRGKWLRAVFAPPVATAVWRDVALPETGLDGIGLLESDTLLDEARLIAIALRQALETPGKTAALVTPDRTLARMVAAQMQRFGVTIDDSAGRLLAQSAPGCFLRLVIDMVASRAAPAALLAALRHPLAGAGRNTAECRQLSRELELSLLRGIRRKSGFSGLRDAAVSATLKKLLDDLHRHCEPLAALFQPHRSATFTQLLDAHIACTQWLAGTDEESGEKRLWAGEAGNALAAFIAELRAQSDVLPAMDPLVYPGLFDTLVAPERFRSQAGLHPRLHILSPMEARLQQYDLVILGSLNEGSWPSVADADPWMSRPMRAAFGLPSPEQDIGRSAHDVMMLAHAPELLLSRARKVEGAPTVPSRWWVRLKTLAQGRMPERWAALQREEYFSGAKELLDTPAALEALTAPAPFPPLAARPRALRVTAIDQWLRDPYMVYARYILRLKKLEDIDREPDAADFGNLVHKALERFAAAFPSALPEDAPEQLLACGREAFADFIDRPAVACLWWPRFEAMTGWLLEVEQQRRAQIATVFSEVKGVWHFSVDGNAFSLTTRIDRLELRRDGTLAIIDYKTGSVPSKSEIERGLASQLPLEALISTHGQLSPPVAHHGVGALEYWKLSGEEIKCSITPLAANSEDMRARLEALIRRFDDPRTPYAAQTDPSLLPRYNDYEHLTRRKEWEAV